MSEQLPFENKFEAYNKEGGPGVAAVTPFMVKAVFLAHLMTPCTGLLR